MKKFLRFKNILLVLLIGLFISGLKIAASHAEEEPVTLKYGMTSANVNVRTGAGEDQYPIMTYNGNNIQLPNGTSVIIVGEATVASSGRVWYNIIFYLNGVELEGWATSSYIKVTGTVTATPTPTPEATDTPTPTPTSTPTPTAEPTNTTVPVVGPKVDDKSGIYQLFWQIVIAILVISVVVVIVIYVYNRVIVTKSKSDEINKKMKYLKSVPDNPVDTGNGVTTVKRPTVRVVEENSENAEGDGNTDERVLLRAKLDKLKQHDIVTHKFFGKGEVYDNSDVKLMEVRFGMDVRYLNKDSLAAKKLLTFEEDDSIITRKKL